MAIPSPRFKVYVRADSRNSSVLRTFRLGASVIFACCLVLAIATVLSRKGDESELFESENASEEDEMKVLVTVPKGANPGQILRVLVPGHSGLVYAKVIIDLHTVTI